MVNRRVLQQPEQFARSASRPRAVGGDSDTQKQILRAAADIFRQVGYDRASTRQIAAAANVQQGLLYYYFKSKQHILFEILMIGMLAVLEPAHEILRSDLP